MNHKPRSSLYGNDSELDGQEVHNCWEGNDHEDDKDEESSGGNDKEKEWNDVDPTMLNDCGSVIACLPLIIMDEMQAMFVRLLFSQMVVEKLVEDQGIDSLRTLAGL